MTQNILILGIDTFEKKNKLQIEEMNKRNFFYHIFTNDLRSNSNKHLKSNSQDNYIILANKNFISRIIQIFFIIKNNNYAHVELYPSGRMAIFYLLFCKLFEKKIIVVERGDIGLIDSYSLIIRMIIKLAYKNAHIIWYKEPYMKELLSEYTNAEKLTFLPNAVHINQDFIQSNRKTDFAWVNRLIPQRRSDWLIDSLNDSKLINAKTEIYGFQNNAGEATQNMQDYVEEHSQNIKVILHEYTNPKEIYKNTKFFVLPTHIVFGNNSLLESMSYGAVPIVSETKSTHLIVEDGFNGIVFPHTKKGLNEALNKAYNMSDKEWNMLSKNAKKTVSEKYNPDGWGAVCNEMYTKIL